MSTLRRAGLMAFLALTVGGCLVRGPGLYLERDQRHHGRDREQREERSERGDRGEREHRPDRDGRDGPR